jgi:hypothetical protein
MPYILQERREIIRRAGDCQTAGELNFYLTNNVLQYLQNRGTSYQTMNDIVGALDNCKDEFRRRVQHPYEDQKIIDNGDVYT